MYLYKENHNDNTKEQVTGIYLMREIAIKNFQQ